MLCHCTNRFPHRVELFADWLHDGSEFFCLGRSRVAWLRWIFRSLRRTRVRSVGIGCFSMDTNTELGRIRVSTSSLPSIWFARSQILLLSSALVVCPFPSTGWTARSSPKSDSDVALWCSHAAGARHRGLFGSIVRTSSGRLLLFPRKFYNSIRSIPIGRLNSWY